MRGATKNGVSGLFVQDAAIPAPPSPGDSSAQ
jgi:hypothetical protein